MKILNMSLIFNLIINKTSVCEYINKHYIYCRNKKDTNFNFSQCVLSSSQNTEVLKMLNTIFRTYSEIQIFRAQKREEN